MPPKERRKGKKEIHKDNIETLNFYWKFVVVGTGVQVAHNLFSFFLSPEFSGFNYFFLVLAVAVQFGCYSVLHKMATPDLGPNGELREAGMDLAETYFSEYAIDFIILTSGVQVLSALSNYMWCLWLLGPGYLMYKLWAAILWPWFTSGPSGGEQEERKKQKQKHRKAKVIH